MRKPLLPSEFLPAFFRLDLSGPMTPAHALLQALDNSVEGITYELLGLLHTAEVAHQTGPRLLKQLSRLGFQTQKLPESKRKVLLDRLPHLLAQQGTLNAIGDLAQIYFERATVFRGSRFRAQAPHRSRGPLRLVDTAASASIVSVELFTQEPTDLVREFSRNASQLVPSGFRVQVIPALQAATPKATGIRLEGTLTTAERRL